MVALKIEPEQTIAAPSLVAVHFTRCHDDSTIGDQHPLNTAVSQATRNHLTSCTAIAVYSSMAA
jgi:hypothetical protein